MEIITRAEAKAQGLKRYFTGKPCKHGHVSERNVGSARCSVCNKDKIKAYYDANKDKKKAYRDANKVKIAKRDKAYREANPLLVFTRQSLHRIEKAIGKDRINRAEVELGYTQDDFKQQIESLWLDGMSWDNRSEWHIDHIKPLSLFLDEGITGPAIINALDNLQPLWAKDNLSKGAKFEAA